MILFFMEKYLQILKRNQDLGMMKQRIIVSSRVKNLGPQVEKVTTKYSDELQFYSVNPGEA